MKSASLLMAIAAFCTAQPQQSETGGRLRVASVMIAAVDSFGSPLGEMRVMHFVDDAKHDLAASFQGAIGRDIPYGSYWLQIQTSKGPIRERVLIARKETFLVLVSPGLTIEYRSSEVPFLRGQVRGAPDPPTLLWVKLCGVYVSDCKLAGVDGSKQFTFVNPSPGIYTISLLTPSKVLILELVDIRSPNSKIILNVDADRNRVTVTDPR